MLHLKSLQNANSEILICNCNAVDYLANEYV